MAVFFFSILSRSSMISFLMVFRARRQSVAISVSSALQSSWNWRICFSIYDFIRLKLVRRVSVKPLVSALTVKSTACLTNSYNSCIKELTSGVSAAWRLSSWVSSTSPLTVYFRSSTNWGCSSSLSASSLMSIYIEEQYYMPSDQPCAFWFLARRLRRASADFLLRYSSFESTRSSSGKQAFGFS